MHSLGRWTAQSHQDWSWFSDSTSSNIYHKQHNIFVRYKPTHHHRRTTRSGIQWYSRDSIDLNVDPSSLFRCTITQSHNQRIAFHNLARFPVNNLPTFYQSSKLNESIIEPYYRFHIFTDHDDGFIMSQKLLISPSTIVGDGSYEKSNDSSAASFIWETNGEISRITNATMVPINSPTIFQYNSDPYRCELFSILLALMSILDMEKRFGHTYQPITISVDNDSALDMAIIFIGIVQPTSQHYDIISSIRSVLQYIKTPLSHARVKGYRDLEVPFYKLTKLEKLNYECDLLAKFARTNMCNHSHLMPSLELPYERIAIYHGEIILYQNFNAQFLLNCYRPRVQHYYCRKYQWEDSTLDNINWQAIEGAMRRFTPSTAKWVTKFSTGFIGTGKCLARREYWLDPTCPSCHHHSENNVHIILCPHPTRRQHLLRQFNNLYEWMNYVRFPESMVLEIQRITLL